MVGSVYPTIYDLRLVGYIVITHLTQPGIIMNTGIWGIIESCRTDGGLSVVYIHVRSGQLPDRESQQLQCLNP